MDAAKLQSIIEEKRRELNSLVGSDLSDLCKDEVLRISTELDALIASYIRLRKDDE
jgi:hypothetical protein